MKKILLAIIAVFVCGGAPAADATYNCKPQKLAWNRIKGSNEYLYLNDEDKKDGRALVCGHIKTDGCKNGTVIVLPNEEKKVCKTGGGAIWLSFEEATFPSCNINSGYLAYLLEEEPGILYTEEKRNGYTMLTNVCKMPQGYCFSFDGEGIYRFFKPNSIRYEEDEYDGHYVGFCMSDCYCSVGVTQCNDGYEFKDGDGWPKEVNGKTIHDYCVEKQPAQSETPGTEPPAENNTEQTTVAYHTECDCPGNSHGTKCHGYNNKCVPYECADGYCLARMMTGQNKGASAGWCKAGATVPNLPYCQDEEDKLNAAAKSTTAPATNEPDDEKSDENPAVAQVSDTRNGCEKGTPGYIVFNGECMTTAQKAQIESQQAAQQEARKQIETLYAEIQDINLGDDNVWKNKDGKFNTARLASDTIAAVTLGTIGGVITSTLVKKHQVKDGFEDIKCYIGGQSTATYGDEFSVGVR